ncbi:MAG TPA: hypothetical protein PLN17_02645 [Candidatus Cloacimonas sp.]|jgi:hypothetical protein|nr:hypothetical protein [Candidatus Cloacimonas sp.]MCK9164422.1 hypothetical protein [Candidatus Cloacimonas sp.]HNV92418.1 hypothetical protein [Candidatus Cloacimonas sp.]HNZ32783.1 hypothetical protein [Candidatus Cloacimonas sp.]HOG26925.1 hypothetical protein [Candidatus Cloacimonas sp.]
MRFKVGREYIVVITTMLILLCYSSYLISVTTENSASASALSGVTILSDSPADYILSPIIGSSGICLSWQQPYSIDEINIYGLHSAFKVKPIIVATGIAYLAHPDYRYQDEYLALSAEWSCFHFGLTQHLVYEKIEEQSWFTWDNDLALALQKNKIKTEIRCNHLRTEDIAVTLSAAVIANESSSFSSTYSWRKNDRNNYCLATSFAIAKPLLLQCSWQNEPARFGVGMKVMLGKMSVMYAVRTHTELGLTHIVDLGSAW